MNFLTPCSDATETLSKAILDIFLHYGHLPSLWLSTISLLGRLHQHTWVLHGNPGWDNSWCADQTLTYVWRSCPVTCGLCVADAGAVADRCPPVQALKKSPSIDSVSASRPNRKSSPTGGWWRWTQLQLWQSEWRISATTPTAFSDAAARPDSRHHKALLSRAEKMASKILGFSGFEKNS